MPFGAVEGGAPGARDAALRVGLRAHGADLGAPGRGASGQDRCDGGVLRGARLRVGDRDEEGPGALGRLGVGDRAAVVVRAVVGVSGAVVRAPRAVVGVPAGVLRVGGGRDVGRGSVSSSGAVAVEGESSARAVAGASVREAVAAGAEPPGAAESPGAAPAAAVRAGSVRPGRPSPAQPRTAPQESQNDWPGSAGVPHSAQLEAVRPGPEDGLVICRWSFRRRSRR